MNLLCVICNATKPAEHCISYFVSEFLSVSLISMYEAIYNFEYFIGEKEARLSIGIGKCYAPC